MKPLSGYSVNGLCGSLMAALAFLNLQAAAELLPFPLSANQRGLVHCLEKPTLAYDVYLPPAYSTNGPPLPILYTFNPTGGGMVSHFQAVCSSLNIICIGVIGSKNDVGWDPVMRELAPVTRDVRQRVLFDPTAEFGGGFSGGGLVAYMYSRFRSQHVAGVFAMAGWLGRGGGYPTYQTTDRVLTNLLVARSRGLSDGGGWVMMPDSNYLSAFSVVFHDEYFSGGHQVPPDTVKSNCLVWLIEHRTPAGPNDQSNALAQASVWRTRIAAGEREAVLRECMATLMNQPRSWNASQAQLVLDDLMLDYDSFQSIPVNDLSQGDYAADLFYFLARGAGDAGDVQRYRSSLKALTGITGSNGDRAGDIRDLLVKYGYPASTLQCALDADQAQINVWFRKNTPGLTCSLESRADLAADPWLQVAVPVVETNTMWSAQIALPAGPDKQFYRLNTTPAPATSPPWPPQ